MNEANLTYIKSYKQAIETELKGLCESLLNLIDNYLLPGSQNEESIIFFNKMKGDYNRYLTEFLLEAEGKDREK